MTAELTPSGTKAGADFNTVTFVRLTTDFKALSPEAASILSNFQTAASNVGYSKNAFNASAKPASAPVSARPSLLSRLRSAEEMIALRQFAAAREELVGLNPDIGEKIAKIVEKKLARRL